MTDKEILAELKRSYEYLKDIRENGCVDHCNGQMKTNIDKLDNALSNIEDIYYDFYRTLDIEDLSIKKFGNKFGGVYINNDVTGDYKTGNNDYITCEDVEYYWYEDEDFISK